MKLVLEAKRQEKELLEKARTASNATLEQAKDEVRKQAEQARVALRGEVATMAAGVAAKVLGR